MVIAHLITGLHTGGAEVMLCNLLEGGARSARWDHHVLALGPSGGLSERAGHAAASLAHLGMRPGSLPSPRPVLSIAGWVRSRSPSVIQGWMYHGNLAALWAKLSSRGKSPSLVWNVRASIQGAQHERRLTERVIAMGAPLSRYAGAIIYNSRASAVQHEAIGYAPSRRVVIPNGFDCERFRPDEAARARLRRELRVPPDRVVLGLVARWDPFKDHANLFRAVGQLRREGRDTHLVLVGRGIAADNPGLVAALREAGLEEGVDLLGERHDVPELLAGLDIACLSSNSESFPNVLGEALACGVPCVTTDVGDAAWIVGRCGLAVPPGDQGAMARGLAELIGIGEGARRALGMEGRRRMLEEFSLARIVDHYHDLYASLVPRRGASRGA